MSMTNLPPIDAPVNAMAYTEKGEAIPFRCWRCGTEACYWNGLEWLCTDHHVEEQQ